MQFRTSISVFHVPSETAESTGILRPAYSTYVSFGIVYAFSPVENFDASPNERSNIGTHCFDMMIYAYLNE